MNTENSLNYTEWEYTCHIVWIPKYRKKNLYKGLGQYLGATLKRLACQKEYKIEEGYLMADYVHILISLPLKYSVAQAVGGGLNGKSAISIARTDVERRKNCMGQNFEPEDIMLQQWVEMRRS